MYVQYKMARPGWMEYRYTIAASASQPNSFLEKNHQTYIDTDSITSMSILSSRLQEAKVRGGRHGKCTYTRMTYNYHCSKNFNQFRDMTAIHTTHNKIPILLGP